MRIMRSSASLYPNLSSFSLPKPKKAMDAPIITAIAILGFVIFFKSLIKIFRWVWITFLRQPKNLKHYGSWALITGATDGIGKALALELASKGLNIVLIGRDPLKLRITENEILDRCSTTGRVEVKKIIMDLKKHTGGEEIAKVIEEGIRGLDVGILINNAGMGYPFVNFFHEVDTETIEGIVRVNIDGVTWVTKAVLPGMLKKKRGAIVNIGSGSSGCFPSFPLYSIYAATKSYIAMFTRSISLEYKQHGIDIQCQIPLLVATKLAQVKETSLFIPSPEVYSRASIRWIGYEHLCCPYWPHYIQWIMLSALPDAVVDHYIFQYLLRVKEKKVNNNS